MPNILFYITNNIDYNFTLKWLEYTSIVNNSVLGLFSYRPLKKKDNSLFSIQRNEHNIFFSKELNSDIDWEFLKNIEKKFEGFTIWEIINVNRYLIMKFENGVLYSYKKAYNDFFCIKFTELVIKEVISVFNFINPKVVIYGGYDVGPFSALIVSLVAKARNIELIVPQMARIFPGTYLNNSIFNIWSTNLMQKNKINNYNELNNFYSKMDLDNRIPEKRRQNDVYNRIKSFYTNLIVHWSKGLAKDPYIRKNPIRQSFFDNFINPLKFYFFKKRFFQRIDFNFEKFFFYPLHIEPELATLLYAKTSTNQIEIIRNVAKALPIEYSLIVKDHPDWIGRRERGFYKAIEGITNVKLVDPRLSSKTLIKNSTGLITVTGTAALENALLNKPSIVFGDTFFNVYFPNIFRVYSFNDLRQYIDLIIGKNHDIPSDNDKEQFLLNLKSNANLPPLGLKVVNYLKNNDNNTFQSYAKSIENNINSLNM